jgi:hypothetical protein
VETVFAMNQRATIALLVLFFVGLLGLKWAEYAKIPDRNERARAEPRVLPELLDLKPDELRRVEVTGGPKRLLFERREGNRWQMVEPFDAAADPSMVESLAFNLKELKKARDIGRMEGKPADYGLETPTRTVTLWGSDASTPLAVLDVGSTAHEMRYVRSKGSGRIEVVDAKGLAPVDLPAIRWRDRSLMRLPSFQVQTLNVAGPGRALTLEREGDGWRITEPIKALGDVNRVEGAVAEVVSLKVIDGEKGFVADDVKDFAPYGLDKPRLTFTASPKPDKGSPQVFSIGNPVTPTDKASRYYARRDDQDDVVLVDATLLKNLGANPLDLHAKRVADFMPDRVDFIRVTSDGATVAVAKTGNVWSRIAPLADAADGKGIDEMLKKVDEIEASELYPPGAAPDAQLDKPAIVLEIWDGAKLDSDQKPTTSPKLHLKVGRRDALRKTAFCQTEGDSTVMAIPLPFIEAIPRGALAFRDRQVARVSPPTLEKIVIKVGPKSRTIAPPAKGADSMAWRLTEPIDAQADPESLGRLFVQLSNLHAETLVTDHPESDAAFGLDKPAMTVSWTTRDDVPASPRRPTAGESVVLTVGKPAANKSGGRYARISTSPIVFTLAPETIAAFDVEWRDRLAMSFDVRQAERVMLKWPSLTLTARRVGTDASKEPDWTLVDPPAGLPFDPSKIKPLLAAMSRLMTFRYEQYDGAIDPAMGLFPARLTITVDFVGGTSKTLSLGKVTPDGYLLATTESAPKGTVFQVALGAWDPWVKVPKVETSAPKPKP